MAVAASFVAIMASCSSGDGSGPAASIYRVVAGPGSVGAVQGSVGDIAGVPLSVAVTTEAGAVASRVTVKFRVAASTGGRPAAARLIDSLATTDLNGLATANVVLLVPNDTASILVAVPGQESRGVTLRAIGVAAPSITSITPASFQAGDTVTVRGSRLGSSALTSAVFFGTARVPAVVAIGDTLVRAIAPPCLAGGSVSLRVYQGTVRSDSALATYRATSPTLSLQPLQSVTLDATRATCAILPAADARYLLVPQYAAEPLATDTVAQRTLWNFSVGLTAPVLAATGASALAFGSVGTPDAGTSLARAFDRELRRRDAALVRQFGPPPMRPQELSVTAPPAVGSTRTFSVLKGLSASSGYASVNSRLAYVGANVLVYVDASPRAGVGFPDSTLQQLGPLFDQRLYPLDVATFGSETDIDNNGRVIVLLTQQVNALTPASSCATSGFIAGFFYGLDLFQGAANSNNGEIFYALVPDPAGAVSCAHTVANTVASVPTTFIHEFQHMISFGQHVLVRGGDDEVIWLNEGLSHIAEETGGRFYESRYPAPAGRANQLQLFPDSAQAFVVPNLQNAYKWLLTPRAVSPMSYQLSGSLEERGASWLFLRWLADQKGEGIFARLVQTRLTGRRNIEAVAGEPLTALYSDFGAAVFVDSLPGIARSTIPARWRFNDARVLRRIFNRFANPLVPVASNPNYPRAFPLALDTVRASRPVFSATMFPGSLTWGLAITTAAGTPYALRYGATSTAFDPFNAQLGAQITVIRLP